MAGAWAADMHKRRSSISSVNPNSPNKKRKASEAVQYPPDETIVRWDQDYEKQNSDLQLAWDQKMLEGKQYTSTKCYKEVHVLMISWDEPSDDLKVQAEVKALGDVFRDIYNFSVHPVSLRNNTNKLPRHQIQKYVGDFVYDFDSPKSLLIVYFAGHGTPGLLGGLELHGNIDQIRAHRNKIIWNHTEGALRGTEGDVLQIFDCCYAGEMAHRGFGTRLYEYLAATSAFETPGPGKTSFTCALIWALRRLSKDGRFTSSDLLRAISQDAPHFPRDTNPVLSKPDGNHKEYIVLEPLSKGGSRSSPHPMLPSSESEHSPPQDILTLRIIFEKRPTVEMIKALGEQTNLIVDNLSLSMEDFQVNRIMWGGLQTWSPDHRSWTRDPIVVAANRFLMLRRSPRPVESCVTPERDALEDGCT